MQEAAEWTLQWGRNFFVTEIRGLTILIGWYLIPASMGP